MIVHRNVAKKHFCPGCDHFHQMANTGLQEPAGACLFGPPRAFIIGMAQSAASVIKGGQPDMVPIIRGYYPPVSAVDTCQQWTPRTEGEA